MQALKSGVLPAIAINLLLGFSIRFVDNAAHIGGLLTGAVLALLIPYASAQNTRRLLPRDKAILALCGLVVLTSFVLAYRHSAPLLDKRFNKVKVVLQNIEAADDAMVNVFPPDDAKADWQPSPQNAAQLAAAETALEKSSAPDEKIENIRLEMIRLMKRQQQIVGQPDSTPLAERLDPVGQDLLKTRKAYVDWLKTEGEKYGFELKQRPENQNKH